METVADLLGRTEELVVRGDYGAVVALLEPLQEAGNPEVLYTLGLACYHLQKYQEAINYLNESLNLKPNYVLALARRGLAYQALGQNPEATADFEQAITIEPQDYHDLRGRGIAFYELKQYEEAIASYKKATEINPNDYNSWASWGVTLGNLGKQEEALTSYNKALDIKPNFHLAHHNRGNALDHLGRYEEALTSYNKALDIKPNFHPTWDGRGNALGNLGRYEEALASYNKALDIKPDDHLACNGQGSALGNLGRNEEALASYNKALEIKPDFHEAWNNRGIALWYYLDRYEEALASHDKAIDIKPDYHDAWHGRGSALANLDRYEEAIASYDRAIEIKPDFHEAWNDRGLSLWYLDRYEDALASHDKALELKSDYHDAWTNRGNALEKLGRHEEAITAYDRAIDIKPDDKDWYNRGVALGNLGRYEEAITDYDRAIEIKPDKHEAWNNRGAALKNLGRYKEAITSFDKALEIKPDHHEAWDNLRSLATSQLLSFQDWLDLRQICEAGLERITFEQDSIRHLTIYQYYLWVCSRTQNREQLNSLVQEARFLLSRYFAKTPMMPEWEKQRVQRKFVSFKQIEVTNLVQMGDLEKALELAEEWRNYRLNCLISDLGYEPAATTYQQAQQLLSADTAIVYWHYSPVGLTTFILKHNQPLAILPPPSDPTRGNRINIQGDVDIINQIQELEKWLQDWKADYTSYGKDAPDVDNSPKGKQKQPWRSRMQLRLNSLNPGVKSLKFILNIQPLINDHLQGIKNLILIPHRDLHLLPLHFLFPFQFTTTYLPSLQVGLNLQNLPPQPTTAPLLNLHQPTGAPYIEITKDIIDCLNAGVEIRKLPSLNKSQLLQLLGKNHNALQFMGHGGHDLEAPENSYLNLAEEKLLLTDILRHPQLDLSSYRLICLAACESGISTHSLLDEYIGWGSAFLAKGARAVITTLWNVDVRSSAFLMIKFYQIFTTANPKISAPQALREAQYWLSILEYAKLVDWYEKLAETKNLSPQYRDYLRTEAAKLRADPEKMNDDNPNTHRPFSNPYHWAGFICTGLLEQ